MADTVDVQFMRQHAALDEARAARETEELLGLPPIEQRPVAPAPAAQPQPVPRQTVSEGTPPPAPVPTPTPTTPPKKGPGMFETAVRSASEIPPALVVTGPLKAVRELGKAATEFANFAKESSAASGFEMPGATTAAFFDVPMSTIEEREKARAESAKEPFVQPYVPESPFDAPKTAPGKIAETVGQFVAGMSAVSRLPGMARLAQMGASGFAGKAAEGAIKGALTDVAAFDPYEERVSNIVQQYGLQNPFTEFMAARPDDPAPVARLRNAVEGAVMGVGADVVMGAFGAWRASRNAKRALEAEAQAAKQAGEAAVAKGASDAIDESLVQLGDPRSTKLTIPDPTPTVAVAGAAPAPSIVNWVAVTGQADVRRVLKAPPEGVARAATKEEAAALEQLLKLRPEGSRLTDAELAAAERVYLAARDKLIVTAGNASKNPTPANLFVFRRMAGTYHLVQRELAGAPEQANSAFKLFLSANTAGAKGKAASVQAALDALGGDKVAKQLADDVAKMSNPKLAPEFDQLVKSSWRATLKEAALAYRYFSLLSGPATHFANGLSGVLTTMQQIAERAFAAKVTQVLGLKKGVAAGEATEYLAGALTGFQEALQALWKSKSFALDDVTGMADDVSAALAARAAVEQTATRQPDAWGLRLAAAVIGVPGNALRITDEVMKGVNFRGEARALALRQANAEVEAGAIAAADLTKRAKQILDQADPEMIDAVVEQSLKATFSNKPDVMFADMVRGFQGFELFDIPIGRLIVPFTKAPINIITYVAERGPAYALSKQFRADVAAGGAREALAVAKVSLGTMTMLSFANLALAGKITGKGPTDPKQKALLKRMGWQPYSIRVGDTWVSYGRLAPLGTMIGLSADLAETAMHVSAEHEKDFGELATSTMFALAQHVTNQTVMKGVSDFFGAMASSETRKPANLVQNLVAGSLIPAGASTIARALDEKTRVVSGFGDALRARIPGLSDTLPARHDLWGREIDTRSPWAREEGAARAFGIAWDALMPVTVSEVSAEPIDDELLRLEFYPGMPDKKLTFGGGVSVDLENEPALYEEFVQLAGNGAKDRKGKGCLDTLNALIKSDAYLRAGKRSGGAVGAKSPQALVIADIIDGYRDLAAAQMLKRHPELKARLEANAMEMGGNR